MKLRCQDHPALPYIAQRDGGLALSQYRKCEVLLYNLFWGFFPGCYWFGMTLVRGFIQSDSKRVVTQIIDLNQRGNLI